jgi:hypothetical protein
MTPDQAAAVNGGIALRLQSAHLVRPDTSSFIVVHLRLIFPPGLHNRRWTTMNDDVLSVQSV